MYPNPDYTDGEALPVPSTCPATGEIQAREWAASMNELAASAGNSYQVARAEVIHRERIYLADAQGEVLGPWQPEATEQAGVTT